MHEAIETQGTARERFETAKSLYSAKRYDESSAIFTELTTSHEFAAKAFYGLGVIALARGNRVGAASNFRTVLSHEPTDSNALYYLGQLAELDNRAQEAVSLYRMVLAANPQHLAAKARLDRLSLPPVDVVAGNRESGQEPDEGLRPKWREWAKSDIGGPLERIDAAAGAAVAAFEKLKDPDGAMAAARQAAYRWDQSELRQYSQPDNANIVRGRVRAIQQRQTRVGGMADEGRARTAAPPVWKILDFKVERVRPDGVPLSTVPVQLRGRWITGDLRNGDIVEVHGQWSEDVLVAREVRSARVDGSVLVRCGGTFLVGHVVGGIFVLLTLAILVVVLWGMMLS